MATNAKKSEATSGVADKVAQMEELKKQMAAMAEEMKESGEVKEAKEELDALFAEVQEQDKLIAELNQKKADIAKKMEPYHELLKLVGDTHPSMKGGKSKSSAGKSAGSRAKKLRDPQTGNEYGSYAEACRDNDIDLNGASGHVKWTSTKGYDLEPVE